MAELKVKKVAVAAGDVSGLKSSRYEKMQVSYGTIAAADYSLGDTVVFSDVPSKDIIKATIVAHTSSPVTLDVYPGTDVSSALTLAISEKATISYVLEYVRGTGVVAGSTGPGDLLQITLGNS